MPHTPHISTLSNGLKIASLTLPHSESVAMSVWVNTGARYETPVTSGISHMLEHMVFKGTKNRSALDIALALDNVGGGLNAYTSREQTVYYAKVLKEDMGLGLDVLADMALHANFPQDELDRERGVVIQEIAQSIDTPDDIIFDIFQGLAFADQPLGRPILGTVENVSRFSREELSAHVARYYCAENMMVTAAGNLSHEALVALAEKSFAGIPCGRAFSVDTPKFVGGEHRELRDLEQVHLVMGFKGLHYHDEDYYPQQLLSMVLGSGMASRLFQEVREKRGLAYTVSCVGSSYADTGSFAIYSGTSEEQANELIAVLCDELCKATHTVTEEELARAKVQVRAGMLMTRDSVSGRCEELGRHLTVYGRVIPMDELLARVNAVQVSDVHRVMKRILSESELTIASIGNVAGIEGYGRTRERLVV